jgi:MYXO-CTERM domain-containing protein
MAQRDNDVPWGLAGPLGLLGLFGLRRRGHAEDGYHPAPVE